MAGYPPGGMGWGGGYAHPAVQQLPQRPQALPIEALGMVIGSRIEVGKGRASSAFAWGPAPRGRVHARPG